MLGSHRSHCHKKNKIHALLTAARASGGKDECQVRLTGIDREYWMGAEIGRLGGYGFRATVTVGDGSNHKGGNGSRLCESAGGKEKAAEEGEMRRGRIQLEPCGTSGLCTGITRHSFDKTHALFVRQPSAVESYEKIGRRR